MAGLPENGFSSQQLTLTMPGIENKEHGAGMLRKRSMNRTKTGRRAAGRRE
jgi:hypothetical protein